MNWKSQSFGALAWAFFGPAAAIASPLHLGAMRCDVTDLEFYIDGQHAPVDDRADGGITPLLALAGRHAAPGTSDGGRCAAAVRYLLQHGAKVDAAREADRRTALHLLADAGDEASVRELLTAGADFSKADKEGNPPVFYAGSVPVAKLLLERGASIDAVSGTGTTPLMTTRSPEVIKFFLEKGVRPEATNARGRTAVSVQEARASGLEKRIKSEDLDPQEKAYLASVLSNVLQCIELLRAAAGEKAAGK